MFNQTNRGNSSHREMRYSNAISRSIVEFSPVFWKEVKTSQLRQKTLGCLYWQLVIGIHLEHLHKLWPTETSDVKILVHPLVL